MPKLINDYAINVDLHRFMLTTGPASQLGIPDVLSFTYSQAPDTVAAHEFILEKVPSADSGYHLRYNVHAENQLLGFILLDRTKKYGINQHIFPFHVDNKAFYILDFAYLIPKFLHVFGFSIHNHSQLDICLFTQQADPAKFIQQFTSKGNEYFRVKRKNDTGIKTFGEKNEVTGKQSYTTYYNHGSQSVTVKMYDKTAELASKPKEYISDWHRAHGFTPGKPVYSVEVSIKAKALKEYRPAANSNASSKATPQTEITAYSIDVERLNQPAYLLALFRHFFPVDIRRKDATRTTNCSRVELFDWSIYPPDSLNKTVTVKPTIKKYTMEKKMLKRHVLDYLDTGNDLYLQVAYAIAARHQLTETLAQLLAKHTPQQAPAIAA